MSLAQSFESLSIRADPTAAAPVAEAAPAVRRASRWPGRLALGVLLLAFALYIGTRAGAGMTEPDDNGYFAQGSLLVTTGQTWLAPASDAQYLGMHWLLTPANTFVSRYPPGFPVLIAAVYATLGWKACAFINPALAIGALAGLYAALRRLAGTGWALVGVALLAINPTFVRHSVAMDSHMSVAFCLSVGVALLVAWRQTGRLWQIFAAGLVLGAIPSARYPDAIVAFGVAVFLLANYKAFPKIWRHYGAAIAGAAVPIVPLLIRNQLVLGAFWRTGYSLTNEQTGFGWGYFQQHFVQYLQTINGEGLGIVFGLGLVGLAVMCCTRGTRSIGALLALATIPSLLLYMAYYWAPAGNAASTMRFLTPTFPLYTLAAVVAAAAMTRSLPRAAKVAVPAVIVVAQVAWGASAASQNANSLGDNKRRAVMLSDEVIKNVPAGSVIVAGNAVQQQLDFVRKWKLADLSLLSGRGGFGGGGGGGGGRRGNGGGTFGLGNLFGGGGGGGAGGPDNDDDADNPSPQQPAKRERERSLYPTDSSARFNKFARDVKTWAAGESIYVVAGESELRQLISTRNYSIVGRFTLPEPEQPPINNRRGGFGGGGGPGAGGPGGGPGAGGPGGGGPGGNRGGRPGGGFGGLAGIAPGDYVIARWTPNVSNAVR